MYCVEITNTSIHKTDGRRLGMSLFDGLKTIWSDPEIRKTAIGYTAAAVVGTGVATYAVTRRATKKWREENEAYLAEPEITTVDGELYRKLPNGYLQPYFPHKEQARNSNRNSPKKRIKPAQHHALPQTSNAEVIYIKGRPFRIDEYGNYTPIRMIGK